MDEHRPIKNYAICPETPATTGITAALIALSVSEKLPEGLLALTNFLGDSVCRWFDSCLEDKKVSISRI